MESYLNENFDLEAKNSSQKALQRWREVCAVVKNPKRRFRFTANLPERSEAIRRSNQVQERIRIALWVQKAALQFIMAGDSLCSREIVYRRGPGCKPKSS